MKQPLLAAFFIVVLALGGLLSRAGSWARLTGRAARPVVAAASRRAPTRAAPDARSRRPASPLASAIHGTVFEDANYGGGAGRSLSESGNSPVGTAGDPSTAARVEFYDASGAFEDFVLTSTSAGSLGEYQYAPLTAGPYAVRVVNGSVHSNRPGGATAGLLPVLTYAGSASDASARQRVGGAYPARADAPEGAPGNTLTTAPLLVAGRTGPGAVAENVPPTAADVDFGFNFDLIVNPNDDGPGSLRQFIANSNALGGESSLRQQGFFTNQVDLAVGAPPPGTALPPGAETSIFMIADGRLHPGLLADLPKLLSAQGVARIQPLTYLGDITGPATIVNGLTQTYNVGNTNDVLLGTGGEVGTGVVLNRLNGPEVELAGLAGLSTGLALAGDNDAVLGLAVYGFGFGTYTKADANLRVRAANVRLTQNVVGTTATSFTNPGAGTANGNGIVVQTGPGALFLNNLVGYHAGAGIFVELSGPPLAPIDQIRISKNEIVYNGLNSTVADGIDVERGPCLIYGNLLANNLAAGFDSYTSAGGNSLSYNTITGNGSGAFETAGLRFFGVGNVANGNLIYDNYGAGILETSGASSFILGNSIYHNGSRALAARGATGELGIDLELPGDDYGQGTAPYVTFNDANDGLPDYPVLTAATVTGGVLTLTGFSPAGALLEFFVAQPNALAAGSPPGNHFGQGQLFLTQQIEGSSDLDNTSGDYGVSGALVNGFYQGTATNQNRFRFELPLSSLSAAQLTALRANGAQLTATAMLRTGGNAATSEFSGNVPLGVALTGVVFEDASFGGGSGRSLSASAGTPQPGTTVELYDQAGAFVASTLTDATGQYSFSVPTDAAYTVRVVSGTVRSARPGYVPGLRPVLTFNGQADHVGGENPALADAPPNAGTQSLASLTTATTTAQCLAPVELSGGGRSGVDFGFNFDLVVNPNDDGPGSLRQFILNSNALGGESSLAQLGLFANQTDLAVGATPPTTALPAGFETSIFMISDGRAHPGLRAGLPNQLTAPGGVATLTLASPLPALTGPNTSVNGLTQTHNVGNTNDVLLGTGGTVGVDKLPLSQLNGPEVELVGSAASPVGLDVDAPATGTSVLGLAVYGFGPGGAYDFSQRDGNVRVTAAGVSLSQNVLGTTATSFTDPGPGLRSRYDNLWVSSSATGTRLSNSLLGFANGRGVMLETGSTGAVFNNNELRGNAVTINYLDGVDIQGGTATLTGNLCVDNGGVGFDSYQSPGGNLLRNNTVRGNGHGTPDYGPNETAGIRLYGAGNEVSRNVLTANYGAGILVTSGASTSLLSQNSTFANGTDPARDGSPASGQLGIDLLNGADRFGSGSAPFVTVNDDGDADAGGNDLLNFPVFESASLSGGTLTLRGWASPGARLEVFLAQPNTLSAGSTLGNGFGQGQTYLLSATEGSAADLDPTSGSYGQSGALVNGVYQGSETNQARFRFQVPLSSLSAAQQATLVSGAALTATATLGGSTSEFSGNVPLGVLLTGLVFEDANYGGGAGRSLATSAGAPRPGATVELYDAAGSFVTATTTDAAGRYAFSAPTGSYTVRVVSSSVSSARPGAGAGLLPVPTYNGTADYVGGEAPEKADAPANPGRQSLASLTTATTTAQCLAAVTVSAGGATGPDFGFNFDLIVNTNDAGPGSLRQFILNSNALTNGGLAQAGLPAGVETSLFMVPDGAPHPGLRAGPPAGLTAGVALIKPLSALPAITDAGTAVDGTTQTRNVGDTNAGLLGTGGFVGTGPNGVVEAGGDDRVLDRVGRPEVQLEPGGPGQRLGLDVQAAQAAVRGLAVLGFGTATHSEQDGNVRVGAVAGFVVEDNFLGLAATKADFATGSGATGRGFNLVFSGTGNGTASGAGAGLVQRNLVGYVNSGGISTRSGAAGVLIRDNEIRNNVIGAAHLDAVDLFQGLNMVVTGNLIADNDGAGVNNFGSAGGHVLTDNTITGNGQGGSETSGVRLFGQNNSLSQNIIRGNYGAGIQVVNDSDHNAFSRNAIGSNGLATSQIGIDLQAPSDTGNPPFTTLNDGGDADAGGNGLLNFPVLATATVQGGDLVLTGFAGAGATVELFLAAPDPSGFGQGQAYLGSFVEGGPQDTDPGTGSYGPGPVNGLAQGQDNPNKFVFRLLISSLPAAQQAALVSGAQLTATATLGGNTSEFSGNVRVGVPLTGLVFEDANYGGGAGRSLAASAGAPQPGATVELYDNAGAFVNAVLTDAAGQYTFSVVPGPYTVRVVSGTVHSARPGYAPGLLPVLTFNGQADHVGGENPALTDAPPNAGAQPLATLTTATVTAQCLAPVTAGAGGRTGDGDFGFNFDLVVNTNDAGPGSLRQFILNSNALTNAGLAQAGLPGGVETSLFMVPDGAAHPGLRAGPPAGLTAGVALITPATDLPAITDDHTAVNGLTQTANVGNTNAGLLGTGGFVGAAAAAPLSQFNGPEVQLVGTTSRSIGLDLAGAGSVVTGLAVYGFGLGPGDPQFADIRVRGAASTVAECVVGCSATSFTDPGVGYADGLTVRGAADVVLHHNLIAYLAGKGVFVALNSPRARLEANEVSFNATTSPSADGVGMEGSGAVMTGNLLVGNAGCGLDTYGSSGGNTFSDNTVTGNGGAGFETAGLRFYGSGNAATGNLVANNYGAGILVTSGASSTRLSQNAIFGNGERAFPGGGSASGQVGIDLLSSTDDEGHGTAPYVTPNDDGDADGGGNGLLNFPVLETASLGGGELLLRGYARPGALVEVFLAAPDPTGFGEGQTYLASRTEGSAADADPAAGPYGPGPVNGLSQGEDHANRFAFRVPLAGLSAAQQAALATCGTQLTATATLGGATSEFSGNVGLSPAPVAIRPAAPTPPVCAGGTLRLGAGPRPGYVFTWYNGTTVVNGAGAVLDDSVFVASTSGSYAVQVRPAGCSASTSTSAAVRVTVLPAVLAGTIGADQSLCAGTPPTPLASQTPASGGTGTLTYQWESSADNLSWTAVSGATSPDYAPGPLGGATTYFRRQARSGSCAPVPTAPVTLSVRPTLVAGRIGAAQTLCAGAAPTPFTSLSGAGGGTGTFAYQWESSADNVSWATVSGATSPAYAPGPVTATTYFRRQVTSGTGSCASTTSNVLALSVLPVLTAGSIGPDQTVCPGAPPAPLTSQAAASGGSGSYAYQWEASADNLSWATVIGATGADYAPGPVGATTYFRRQVSSGAGSCAAATSNVVVLRTLPGVGGGSIGASQALCAPASPAPLTSRAPASGGTGSYTYQWESSADNLTFTDISGATSPDYAPGALPAGSTYFRRRASSGSGSCAVAFSNVLTLTLTPALSAGAIAAAQTLCAGTPPAPLTSASGGSGGSGSYAYQWEASADNLSWTTVIGATGADYVPGPLATTTYFRRQVSAAGPGGCAPATSNVLTLNVLPALTAGSIGTDQTLCAGAGAAPLTSQTAASGGTGSYAYQWEASTDNVSWTALAGATAADYAPGPLAATTYFRRQVSAGPCTARSSNTVKVSQLPALAAGRVGPDQTLCAGGARPAPLTSQTPASGGTGSYTYQWESSADNVNWTALAGATGADYQPGPLAATTYFRRQVRSGGGAGSCDPARTPVVTLSVPPALRAGRIDADQTLCAGAVPTPLTSGAAASGGTGSYAYQWEASTDNVSWTAVAGATGADYAPGALAVTTYFRRGVAAGGGAGSCGAATSNVVTLQTRPAVAAGSIGTNQTSCGAPAAPAPLTSLAPASGGTGSYAYQWEVSADKLSWTAVSGATGADYAPAAQTGTRYFRRQVSSGSGSCATATSNVLTLNSYPDLTAGTVAADQTRCAGTTPAPLTAAAAPTGGPGTYSYQWESSADKLSWTVLAGATAADYAPGPLAATTYFRRQVSAGPCTARYSNTVKISQLPALAAGSVGADQSLCAGAAPAPLTSLSGASGGTGTFAYQWESSADNVSWTGVAGATGADYQPGPLAATTYFRRQVAGAGAGAGAGSCGAATSNVLTLTVAPALTAGSIGADQALCAATVPAPLTSQTVASGGSGSYAYQWESSADKVSWTPLAGATGADYAPPGALAATTYFRRAVVAGAGAGSCGAATSNVLTLTVSPARAATVALSAPPAQCAGATLTFRPTPTNAGPNPSYRWFVNNALAATSPSFSSATLANNDQVRVELTPTPGSCATGTPVATVTVSLTAPVVPALSIRALNAGGGPACAGTLLQFEPASVRGAGASPQYQWLLNGAAVAGATDPTFTSATLRDGDHLRLQLRSSEACANPAQVLSNELTISLLTNTPPTATISGSGGPTCASAPLSFRLSASTGLGAATTFQWLVDGQAVAGAQSSTFSAGLRDGQLVSLRVSTVAANCGQPLTAVSNALRATVLPTPLVSAGPDQEIAEGESVVLEGSANGTYPVEWSPSTSLSFPSGPLRPLAAPTATTVYTLTARVSGCPAESKVTVKVGPPIGIPSAFSPNGDGVNDTWELNRIARFPGNTVRIFNRWGNQIFAATDYGRGHEWDGTSQGRAAPIGTYYYVITLGNGRSYSGPITVVY